MRTMFTASLIAAAVSVLAVGGSPVSPARAVTLKSGTVIPVTLDQNLSSDQSMKGETFTATVRAGYQGLPEGTRLRGVVRNALARDGKKPGALVLSFTRIMPPNAGGNAIDGSPVGLDTKSVTTNRDGRIVAKSGVKNKRLTYVGYGAGAGALVAVLGGGKNLVRDTVIGAGLGYLVGALEKGGQKNPNNVMLKTDSKMGVLLHSPVTVRF